MGGPSVGVLRLNGAIVGMDEATRSTIMARQAGTHGTGVEGMPVQLSLPQSARDESPMPTGDGGMTADAAADGAPADAPGDAGAD